MAGTRRHPYLLFPDAECTKDTVQEIVRVDGADNFSQFVEGDADFLGRPTRRRRRSATSLGRSSKAASARRTLSRQRSAVAATTGPVPRRIFVPAVGAAPSHNSSSPASAAAGDDDRNVSRRIVTGERIACCTTSALVSTTTIAIGRRIRHVDGVAAPALEQLTRDRRWASATVARFNRLRRRQRVAIGASTYSVDACRVDQFASNAV